MKKAICYYRVSTKQQGNSGLGLEAQQKAVQDFVKCNDFDIVLECTEVESGKNDKRPVLTNVLLECHRQKAVLVIAKLDRLSRNVAFISALTQSRVEFIAVDMPYADKFFIHIMAAYAEYERDQASRRTKAALQAAKERGIVLGRNGKDVLSKKNRQAANEFAEKMIPVIEALNRNGVKTIRQIAKELNRKKIAPYHGREFKWHPFTVHRLLARISCVKSKIGLNT